MENWLINLLYWTSSRTFPPRQSGTQLFLDMLPSLTQLRPAVYRLIYVRSCWLTRITLRWENTQRALLVVLRYNTLVFRSRLRELPLGMHRTCFALNFGTSLVWPMFQVDPFAYNWRIKKTHRGKLEYNEEITIRMLIHGSMSFTFI